MPWGKYDDRIRGNPKLRAAGKAVRGGLLMLWGYCSEQPTDGWVPEEIARQELTERELVVACGPLANSAKGLLHKPGDECGCLLDKDWRPEMGGFWVHDWFDHNPSKAENRVHRAKRKELGDKDLRYLVQRRDGNACRYCGQVVPWADKKSDRALCIDHVNPTLAAGAGNLVVACTGCNSRKKDAITPEAAGLTLLPPPVDPPTEWPKGTDPASIARAWPVDPESTDGSPDRSPDSITDRSPDDRDDPSLIDRPITHRPGTRPIPGDTPAKTGDELREHTADASPDAPIGGLPPRTGRDGSGGRSSPDLRAGDVGPQGRRPVIGPATTPRSATSPPTYRKSATSNPPPDPRHAGHPPDPTSPPPTPTAPAPAGGDPHGP